MRPTGNPEEFMKTRPERRRFLQRAAIVAQAFSLLFAAAAFADESQLAKSELDDRSYRYLVLENGMQVMLVSDAETDKAAASLDVAVGHGSDPANRQGLAHFLEHMLFLGTEKYPEPGEYQAFIKDHGGSHNAYTSYDHTNYFFSIRPEFLIDALDRFSQFFVAPLFNEELVKRERVIVDSEYSARSEEEGRRTLAAQREALNPDHPRSAFAVGSIETLADREGDPVREDLIDFYEEHYSAHLMSLAVIGRDSLDTLEAWVRARFAAVRRTGATRFVADVPLFRDADLPLMLEVKPLKERRVLTFSFEVPGDVAFYRKKPIHQIANILGHEGEGSLLAALKSRGWADALSAGAGAMDPSRGLLEIHIDLTTEGADHVAEIGEMLFSAVDILREKGLEAWRFEEQRTLAEMGFRYSDKPDALSLVRAIADRLHDYPWYDVLYAPYVFETFDPGLVGEYLDLMRPQRVAVTLVSPDVEPERQEKWFEVGYTVGDLDPSLVERWEQPSRFADLSLPPPNPFVPDNLEMVADEDDIDKPRKLLDDGGWTLWHDTDTSFGAPRAEFYFSFRSPRSMGSPGDAALLDLFTKVIEDRLNTFSYPAYLAGLGFEVYPHLRGFSVRVSGFSDRQPHLVERIVANLRGAGIDPMRFRRLRAKLVENYRNRLLDSPASLAVAELQRLLIEDAWPIEQRIEALETAGVEDFQRFIDEFFEQGNVLALSVGNRTKAESRAMAEMLDEVLMANVEPAAVPRSSVVRLDPAREYERVVDSAHNDSVVALYRQGADDSYTERALFYLYDQLSDSAFYQSLRTEQKLGYVVQSFAMPIIGVPGMMYLVQSPSTSAATTERAIREFIGDFGLQLTDLPQAALDGARAALLSRINQRDDALSDRADRYWRELDDEEYGFDSRERLSGALEAITIEEMRQFAARYSGSSTPSLVLHAAGGIEPAEGEEGRVSRSMILDHAAFKQGHAVF